ncbi:hypothetical protein LRP30_30915 [Bradyrhizobium sp. C-145]|uniref:hypothetical protein n=1 Tax=Bradyrhizobium sp. C-145 TaxID=574727 RepID=UPI00201B5C4A|nr:hypothetical protein [Bradyrhizobium sp. C-145]UQR61333.1 hypothetical protein LRP30_30915 [Bradyrhizobium sp. C-145]
MKKPTLYDALEQFEAIEANLAKLERLCGDVESLIPTGISFGSDPAYEDKCRAAAAILEHMPAIDGWQLKLEFFDLDEIAQIRFDLAEIMEPAAEASFENSLQEPSRQLREYRFRFNRKRRQLIRHALDDAIDQVDRLIRATRPAIEAMEPRDSIPKPHLPSCAPISRKSPR